MLFMAFYLKKIKPRLQNEALAVWKCMVKLEHSIHVRVTDHGADASMVL